MLVASTLAWGQEQIQSPEKSKSLSSGLLDVAYVDLTNGFTVRAPAGSMIVPTDAADPPTLPLLAEWDQLKHPESKELIRFRQPFSDQHLTITLMVTRKKMTVEKMTEARGEYWQQFDIRATILDVSDDTLYDHPAVVSSIEWQALPEEPNRVLRETIIQLSKKRYFAILHSIAADSMIAPPFSLVAERVASNFQCLSKADIDQRWHQAKKNGKTLLASLESGKIKEHLIPLHWYRILYKGEDAGFHLVEERVQLLPEKQHAFVVRTTGYLDNPKAILPYFEMHGWRVKPTKRASDDTAFARPIQWVSEFSLDGKLHAEQFDVQLTDLTHPDNNLCERGQWRDSTIRVTDCRENSEDDMIGAPLEIALSANNQKNYLSRVNTRFVHRFIKNKIGDEYIFVRYINRNIGYFSLRVNAEIDLKVEDRSADVPGSPDSSDKSAAKSITAYYSIAQLSSKGPIVEYWTNEKGALLRQKSGYIELQQSHHQEIRERWPKQMEAMELTDKKPKPKE